MKKPLNRRLQNKFTKFISSFFILFILASFNFIDSPESNGWSLQVLPIGNQISDITFTDSLTGYIVTWVNYSADTSCYLLKTTNGGNNWITKLKNGDGFCRIIFCDKNIGYACTTLKLYKTINAGSSWDSLLVPDGASDMYVLNKDTLWITDPDNIFGGLFRTNDGGQSWTRQNFYPGHDNPDAIYMYNNKLGFTRGGNYIARTIDGGLNWTFTQDDTGYIQIYFIDSLTGWKTNPIRKTTNGGITWQKQFVQQLEPYGGWGIAYISVINKDTIYASGDYSNQGTIGGLIYKTTNGGTNWWYQIPGPNFGIGLYKSIKFINAKIGWVVSSNTKIIHTTTGGDSIYYVGINDKSEVVPKNFVLYQNYPNPFNPVTKIKFDITHSLSSPSGFIGDPVATLKVYNILGKEVATLINNTLQIGTYEVTFNGSNLSSGTYFYKLQVGDYSEIKKMLMIK